MFILSLLFFVTAILYSSVGFGGGSTYLALLLIWDIPYYIIPVIALFCNIIVVSGNSINFIRSGNLNIKLLIPYLIGSIPFAFIGGSIQIEKEFHKIFLSYLHPDEMEAFIIKSYVFFEKGCELLTKLISESEFNNIEQIKKLSEQILSELN